MARDKKGRGFGPALGPDMRLVPELKDGVWTKRVSEREWYWCSRCKNKAPSFTFWQGFENTDKAHLGALCCWQCGSNLSGIHPVHKDSPQAIFGPGIMPATDNQEISPDELADIRSLDDFDLTMVLSQIHDDGWPSAQRMLPMATEASRKSREKK